MAEGTVGAPFFEGLSSGKKSDCPEPDLVLFKKAIEVEKERGNALNENIYKKFWDTIFDKIFKVLQERPNSSNTLMGLKR